MSDRVHPYVIRINELERKLAEVMSDKETLAGFMADIRMRLSRGDGPRSLVIERAFDVMNARSQKRSLRKEQA